MPKITVNFDLPEEQSEYDTFNNARNYYCALWDLSQQLRQWYKYDDRDSISIEELQNKFYEILDDNKVTLDN